ncbi:hypothetical protein GCM10023205_82410 [Yinghuangia aomiensis]|uniref:Lipoprotein n=1 Tax=Yinghuangia aomiensis TaxID=676205 RepID=A0ABP9IFD9_9ACTN
MIERAKLPAAVAVLATITLVASCGGGSGHSGKDAAPSTTAALPSAGPSGVVDSPSAASSPFPSTSPSGTGVAPLLALPPDLSVDFAWSAPSDPVQAAALAAAADYLQAIMHAVVAQNAGDPPLSQYATAQALAYAQHYVQENVDLKETITGHDHYYRSAITAVSGSAIQIRFCEDQSKLYSKEIATGKVHITSDSSLRNFVSYNVAMTRLPTPGGVWQASAATVSENAAECKP